MDTQEETQTQTPVGHTWLKWVVSGWGLGLLRPAPGSWGSCAPAIIFWGLIYFSLSDLMRSIICVGLALLASILTVLLGPWAQKYFQKPDPGSMVLDEFAGYWIACLFIRVPSQASGNIWLSWLMAAGIYILFRLFDTIKLPPCRALEKLPRGWGILLDDIAAGVQVNIVLQILLRVIFKG
ncbi:MAG TPA: phosphatidylglycerophosphatase A [Phycisphaerae bacterium]|nr:phosphatidylglycerophosphatase A [Phycisphaerae bacterium]